MDKPAIKYCVLPNGILSSGSPFPARLIFAQSELSCIEGDGGSYRFSKLDVILMKFIGCSMLKIPAITLSFVDHTSEYKHR